jgi:hypothetical protein
LSDPLTHVSPAEVGFRATTATTVRGRARRAVADDGRELWRLPADDPALARLLALGEVGIGGFERGGVDDDGPWLLRAAAEPTLRDAWRQRPGPWPWAEVVALGDSLTAILTEAERRSLRPGALRPDQVGGVGREGGVHLRADDLVDSLCGVPTTTGSSDGHLKWTPAAQARGEAWDAAANRYALGLLLYRALSGEHPFSGKGLRRGFDDQDRGVAPMPDAIAAQLPPGLQALCLRLLDPDPAQRPSDARQVQQRLRACRASTSEAVAPAIAMRRRTVAASPPVVSSSGPAARRPATTAPGEAPARGRLFGWLVAAAAVGAAAVAFVPVLDRPTPPARPTVRSAPPLTEGATSADDCLACHPDHSLQWDLSVMGHAARSPLFQSLEMLIEEQVGRDFDCPGGAGILRPADARTACRDRDSGLSITGSGGELWCVNCHAATDNLAPSVPAWDGRGRNAASRRPLADLLPDRAMEGISCAMCHQTHGPVRPSDARRGAYEGNPTWRSTATGEVFESRPEDRRGRPGIANSGYSLDPRELLAAPGDDPARLVPSGVHRRPSDEARAYLRSSEFCGACHDVRLFGTDVIGVAQRGEHFKRLRNAYSEWSTWADDEVRAGRTPASCQDCHMSTYPAVCDASGPAVDPSQSALRRACPEGTQAVARPPGVYPQGAASVGADVGRLTTHYFSGVDVPLAVDPTDPLVDDAGLDEHGIPRGAKQRRDLLLGRTFRFEVDDVVRSGRRLEVPITLQNTGAGHRVPAGFSQEREIWVHLRVTDGSGRVVYEVGRVDRNDEDLHDKEMLRVNVGDDILDGNGRPLGMFGADIIDGRDVPRWDPPPEDGGRTFRGDGLINLQNGFLRCVQCIGVMVRGRCEAGPGQGRLRSDRFADGIYDPDTGECRGNVPGTESLIETYFPVGALDSTRGVIRGPDAIIDTRSAAPGVPLQYTYDLNVSGTGGPLRVEARLLFRAFPPFLVRAFADYEARQAARGLRPSGPLVTAEMLDRLEVVEIARIEREVP